MTESKSNIVQVSRRGFMKDLFWIILGGTLTTSGSFIKPNKSIACPIPKGDIPMSEFNCQMFADLVGESFNVQQEHRATLKAELIEVNDHSGSNPRIKGNARPECFSILFRGPRDQPLEQNTYNFSHGQTGAFPLFIVPVGIDEKGRLYEAVFNRLQG